MLDKTYSPATLEDKFYDAWEKSGVMECGRKPEAQPFTLMMPPPNVTGRLHIGHALTFSLQDFLVRYYRMKGRDVLYQPGTDHAGIATQMMVERELQKEGKTRHDLGRAEFLKRVWQWKEESGNTIVTQLKKLGASPDWKRERFTLDEGLSHAVRKVFVDLYNQKLIYKDKRLVNWDAVLQTAVSDLEVENKDSKSNLWVIAYPLEDEKDKFIHVATTRPETLLGDVAVAVHPEDERYKNWIGKRVHLPLTNRLIPIVGDIHADPEKGTGAVKITPAHDFNDFEVGKRQGLPMINIMDSYARLNENVPEVYQGLDRESARKKVLEDLEEQGLLIEIQETQNTLPYSERSGVLIEPWLTDQWYVDAHTLAQPALKGVREGKTTFTPDFWDKTYFDWLENIQPWCISRQLWWGHQIPAWYGPDGHAFVAMNEEEAQNQAQIHYGKTLSLTQDEDVLDTWFSSGLWPFSTLGWPKETSEFKRYYPTDVLITGHDILFFWVARMMMMGLHFTGEVPFKKVCMHALVRDEKGQKMSKTKGNVVDPLEMIEQYGADAMRFSLATLAAPGRDLKFSKTFVEGARNFATKLWNAARYCEMNASTYQSDFVPSSVTLPLNQWIIKSVDDLGFKVGEAIETFRFNEASQSLYQYIWGTFCDWYLEFSKPYLQDESAPERAETQATIAWVLDRLLRMLHPFMPYVTEALWQHLHVTEDLLAGSSWPEEPVRFIQDVTPAFEDISWIIEVISEIRSLRAEMNISPAAKLLLKIYDAGPEVHRRARDFEALLLRLARLEHLEVFSEHAQNGDTKGAVQALVNDASLIIPLHGAINIEAEMARLQKEILKLDSEHQGLSGRLNNPSFIERAPEDVVNEAKGRLDEINLRKGKLNLALTRLSVS
ncbi:Valine--tRNA ligase [Candidatus Bealeia paramacronuclearis]|uniref:Valine--tRNA ligase n=1 Tax=Candidatus Bealeia paramacronuclearis TaxID=1921001 RepID=A0ABZ2C3K2_9PROT